MHNMPRDTFDERSYSMVLSWHGITECQSVSQLFHGPLWPQSNGPWRTRTETRAPPAHHPPHRTPHTAAHRTAHDITPPTVPPGPTRTAHFALRLAAAQRRHGRAYCDEATVTNDNASALSATSGQLQHCATASTAPGTAHRQPCWLCRLLGKNHIVVPIRVWVLHCECSSTGEQDINCDRLAKVTDRLVGCSNKQVEEGLDLVHRLCAFEGL